MDIYGFFDSLLGYIRQQSRGVSVTTLLLTWLIAILLIHLICIFYSRIVGKRYSGTKELLWILIAGYVCFGCQITLFRRQPGTRGTVYASLYFGSLTGDFWSRQQFFYSLLNTLFFVPWGILWGFYRYQDSVMRRVLMVTIYSFLTSFSIEVAQLVTGRGFFELSDLITNTAGGLVGSLAASIVICCANRFHKRLMERKREHENE